MYVKKLMLTVNFLSEGQLINFLHEALILK